MYIMFIVNWFKFLKWREIYYVDKINFVFILIYGSIECWVELIVIESMYEVVFVNFWVFYKYDFK